MRLLAGLLGVLIAALAILWLTVEARYKHGYPVGQFGWLPELASGSFLLIGMILPLHRARVSLLRAVLIMAVTVVAFGVLGVFLIVGIDCEMGDCF